MAQCCLKRDLYLSVLTAVDFVKEHQCVEMKMPDVICPCSQINNRSIGKSASSDPSGLSFVVEVAVGRNGNHNDLGAAYFAI